MKTKPKFNLLDAFIILILAAAIALGAFMLLKPSAPVNTDSTPAPSGKATFTVDLTRVTEAVAKEFELAADNKEKLTCGEAERFYSTIKDISVTKAKRTIVDHSTATASKVEDPQFFDVKLILETDVTETDDAITAGKTDLRVGNGLAVKAPRCAGYGYIIGLELN
ncbi:MAG: DUF4330 family protein [Clostridia bacterium]|nr:DUF4330 family protein [Clostridia bacterium]